MNVRTPVIAGAIIAALAGTSGYCAYNAVPPVTTPPITLWPAPAPEKPGLIEPYPLPPTSGGGALAGD